MKHKEEMRGLRDMNDLELQSALTSARQDLFKFRTDLATRSLANVKAIRTAKKRIAKILTVARERELAASGEGK